MSNMSDQREGRSVEGEYGTGPQMKRARKTGVSTTRSVEPPAPPLHSSVSAGTSSAFKCKVEIDDDDNLSITSTTPMSEECCSLEGVVEECNNSVAAITDASATVDTSTAVDNVPPLTPPSFVPRGFRCPLSWQIMLDPVLDGEGNTYEYSVILDWLKVQGHCTSPISHQPLSERMLNPNNSLREAIHEYMGSEWVRAASQQREEQQQHQQQEQDKTQTILNAPTCNMSSSDTSMDSTGEHQPEQQQDPRQQPRSSPHRESTIAAVADPDQRSRQKIDCFLQFVLLKIDGLKSLSLDEYGCCAFQYDGIMIVIDVPLKTGTFCFYTRNLVPYEPTEAMKDLLLELNFLQEGTRGGCLSVKRVDGIAEVLFSYNDRVANTSAQEFLNIFINFCITSSTVRRKLLAVISSDSISPVMQREQQPQQEQQYEDDEAALLANKCPATTSTGNTEPTQRTLDHVVDRKPAAASTIQKVASPSSIINDQHGCRG